MDGRLVLCLLGFSSLVSAADNSYLKGYTTGSCMSLEPPGHIGSSVHIGTGGFSVSINTTEYSPGAVYNVTLSATKYPFTGFMVQGKGRGRTAGTFTDTPTAMSKKRIQALTCNTSKDSLTNFNVDGRPYPVKVSFGWKAPSRTVGDICFKSSVVETASLWFKPLEQCVSPVQQPSTTTPLPISPSGNISVSPLSNLSSSHTATIPTTQSTTQVPTTQVPTTIHSTTQQPTTVASNQPTVRVKPPKLELNRGSVAEFHCDLLGNPAPSLTLWKRAGTNSDLGTGNPLMIRNIQFSDQGVYICEADSGGSTLSASGMLVIKEKPVVVNYPTGLTFVLGNYTKDIQLTCDAVGGNPVSRFWLKDGNTLVGETSHQLILPPVQSSNGGYACNFTNPYGYTLSQTAVITVQVTPNFTVQPQDVWTTAGNLVEFTCQATGNPQPSIQWYKDGSALMDRTSNSLIIASVQKGHEGQYWCTATNVVSVVSSKKASLRVITKEPTFVEQPQSETVNYGNTLTLTCPTLAHPPPNIQWLKDGIPLQGAMGDTLVISSFTDDDNGNYSCNATNTLGYNISSSAEVVVYREAPTFIQQPEGARLFVGNPFNMTCIAKGVPDPTYSWYKTGKLIPGATSTLLVIKSTTFEDSTYYFCAATNIEGRAVSRPLYLLILPLPTTTSIVTSRVPTNGTVATAIVNVTTTEIVNATTKAVPVTSVPSQRASTISATSSTPSTTTKNATTPSVRDKSDTSSSVNVSAIVAPIVVVLGVIIIILVVLLLVQRHRQSNGRRKSNAMDRLALTDNVEIDVISELESTQGDKFLVELVKDNIKSSADLEQLLGRTPTYIHRISKSCPMGGSELQSLLQRVALHPDDSEYPNEVKQQFEETPSNMVTIQKTPAGTESKNRYMNVLPNPHSAVRLLPLNEDPTTTYINANYVRGYGKRPKAYIATQGPIPSTRNDFWRMIWEQHVTTIIMTTGLVERGRMKCCRYWPDTQNEKETTYGNYTVRVVDEKPGTHYTITTLIVKDNNEGEQEEDCDHEPEIRTVNHYWFTGWPDFGIPQETGPVLDFLDIIQKEVTAHSDPVLVHCSAGIGRTGTFIAIEMGMQQYLKEGVVDPLQYMCSMRQDRGGSVQTADQYLFIHKALAAFIARVAK